MQNMPQRMTVLFQHCRNAQEEDHRKRRRRRRRLQKDGAVEAGSLPHFSRPSLITSVNFLQKILLMRLLLLPSVEAFAPTVFALTPTRPNYGNRRTLLPPFQSMIRIKNTRQRIPTISDATTTTSVTTTSLGLSTFSNISNNDGEGTKITDQKEKDYSSSQKNDHLLDDTVRRMVEICKQLYQNNKARNKAEYQEKNFGSDLDKELDDILGMLESHLVPSPLQQTNTARRRDKGNDDSPEKLVSIYALSDIMVSIFHLVSMNHPSVRLLGANCPGQTMPSQTAKRTTQALSESAESLSYSVSLKEPFILAIWSELDRRRADQYLNPQRWLDLLKTMNSLDVAHLSTVEPLYCRLCRRLTKGDALGRLHPNQLIQCLQLFTTTTGSTVSSANDQMERGEERTTAMAVPTFPENRRRHFSPDYYLQPCERELLQAVARRLRKQQVRRKTNNALVLHTVSAAASLLTAMAATFDDEEVADWIGEIQKLAFTYMKERLDRLSMDGGERAKAITLEEMSILFHCAKRIPTLDKASPLVDQLCFALEHQLIFNAGRRKSKQDDMQLVFADVARILGTLAHWRRSNVALECLGSGLVHQYNQKHRDNLEQSFPKSEHVSTIFRSLCLLYPKPSTEIKRPFRELGDKLFCDENFLQTHTSMNALSNSLWFGATYGISQPAAESLGAHSVKVTKRSIYWPYEGHKEPQCSPRMACRILSSFTAMVTRSMALERDHSDGSWLRVQAQLYEMFDLLGEQLLSTQLAPLDASNALMAFAKSQYPHDPGIVDHLAHSMVLSFQDASIRQIVHALWACAKISQVDCGDANQGIDEEGLQIYNMEQPSDDGFCASYLTYTFDMAIYLSHFASELTAKDVAQTIWALARLDIADNEMLDSFLERTRQVLGDFNAQETANCLWGLTKLKHDAFDVVFQLTRKLKSDQFRQSLNLEEASTILYSLGKLDIREEYAFETLSKIILQKVGGGSEQSSPTAIAQVLWAHRQVHLKPPQEILNAWANKKLGLVPISLSMTGEEN